MSKDLKKVIIYSLVPTAILFILSSFISSWSGCELGTLCFNPAQKYYGFPMHYLDAELQITSYSGLIVNFIACYLVSFTSLFVVQLVMSLIQKNNVHN